MDISSNDQDFTKVIDVYNETASVNVSDEKGFITFVGKGSICIVACDKEGTPFYIERTMDFSETTDEQFSPVKSCSQLPYQVGNGLQYILKIALLLPQ